MPWPKKNSYKEFDNEKKFLRLENSSPPPITSLMVRPLLLMLQPFRVVKYSLPFYCLCLTDKRPKEGW